MNEPRNMRLKQRTYNVAENIPNKFECHRCGCTVYFSIDMRRKMRYCCCCGRKVLLRSAYETIEKDILEVG